MQPFSANDARLPIAGVLARCEPHQINHFWGQLQILSPQLCA